MERRILGRTGLEVSVLGFGGAPVGFLETEREAAARLLNALLDRGVNVIDTAAMYRGSEELIGDAVAHRRNDYVLVTKCGQAYPDLPGEAWSPRLVAATVDRALRRLKTERLDVMLLHSCDLETLRRGEALAALVQARDAGKIRFLGYSGDGPAAAAACRIPEIDVVQLSVNVADQANIRDVLPLAAERGLGVIAKRPLANAAWKPLSTQRGIYSEYAREYTERLAAMNLQPRDLGDNRPPDIAWPEIALRFTIAQNIHTAIVGTTNPASAEANLANAEKGPLPPEIVRKIQNAYQNAEAAAKTPWTPQT